MSPGEHRSSHLAGALALTLLALFALAGCGGGKTNGLEKMSAAEVHRTAVAALRSAHSAHVKGVSAFNGNPVQLDLRFDGSSTSGALVADGVRFGMTRIADVTYIKGGRQALERLGAPAAWQRLGAGRWLKLGPRQVTQWEGLSLVELAGQLAENHSPLDPDVAQATLDGKQVVVVSERDGSKLYVDNTGVGYPLRGDFKGPAAGRIDFSEYGADFRITAPEDPLDVGKLPVRG